MLDDGGAGFVLNHTEALREVVQLSVLEPLKERHLLQEPHAILGLLFGDLSPK